MKKTIILTIAFLMLIPLSSYAGADVHVKGLVQTWFSHGDTNDDGKYGFNLRRVRLAPYGSLSKNVKWGFQVAWDKQKAVIYDAYMDFYFKEEFRIKVGQFAAPGIRSGALTSSGALDLIERPMVAQRWGTEAATLGYRAMGIQLHGALMDKKIYYRLMVSNPNASDLFNPGIKNGGYDYEGHEGMTIWGRVEFKPVKGFEIGVFANSGKDKFEVDWSADKASMERESYGFNVFYVKDNVNLKFEYIAGKYGYEDAVKIKHNGFYAVAGYRFGKFEPVVRYGTYTPMKDGHEAGVEKYKDFSMGINYFYNKNVKFQANYIIRTEDMMSGYSKPDNNLFYINFQYSFNSKK